MAELTRFILGGINSRQEFWPIKYSLGILWSRIFRKSVGSKNMVLKDNMFCRKTDNHKRAPMHPHLPITDNKPSCLIIAITRPYNQIIELNEQL